MTDRPPIPDTQLYLRLLVFSGAVNLAEIKEAIENSPLEAVLYASAHDPTGIAVLSLSENPDELIEKGGWLFVQDVFADLIPETEMTMLGRSYASGREKDPADWLLQKPRRNAFNKEMPWVIWYPLRRKPAFYRLNQAEQGKMLMEHGMLGKKYGDAGKAADIRLECFGLDKNDNEFIIGLVGPRLDWLSKLVKEMRGTQQTAEYMDGLGPFFVGRAIAYSKENKVKQ